MQVADLKNYLSSNEYPGRGVLIGKSEDGKNAVIVYFIMGRSENSRNRVFVTEDEGIRTQAFDPAKLSDPSLIIYSPVRVLGSKTVVTNGDQTDTVYDFLKEGKTFEEALRTRTFEPDEPNFTPRISGEADISNGELFYKLSILKSANGNPESVRRYFYEYTSPLSGRGHIIHTYKHDGNPIPSFEGEPVEVELKGDIDSLTENVWAGLNENNKVSLFVRYIDIETGKTETRIVNKNK